MAEKYKVLRKVLAVLLSFLLVFGMAPELAVAEDGGTDGMMGIAATTEYEWGAGGRIIGAEADPVVTVTLTNAAVGTLNITNTAVEMVTITGTGTETIISQPVLEIAINNATVIWNTNTTFNNADPILLINNGSTDAGFILAADTKIINLRIQFSNTITIPIIVNGSVSSNSNAATVSANGIVTVNNGGSITNSGTGNAIRLEGNQAGAIIDGGTVTSNTGVTIFMLSSFNHIIVENNGEVNAFNPLSTVTRAEAAVMLRNFMRFILTVNDDDEPQPIAVALSNSTAELYFDKRVINDLLTR
jgi:hypothetical protein